MNVDRTLRDWPIQLDNLYCQTNSKRVQTDVTGETSEDVNGLFAT